MTPTRPHWTTFGFALLFVFWLTYTAAYGWNWFPEPGTGERWFDFATNVGFIALALCRWNITLERKP